MKIHELLDDDLLGRHIVDRNVRVQDHPTLPLRILNYTEQCAYDGVWDDVTRQCRGLIFDVDTGEVVARPFPKFFNHLQPGAPELDLNASAVVTEKMDGSLGILYPTHGGGYAIATRGSFTSEQAEHATETLRTMYADWCSRPADGVGPLDGWTYLFEIIYPGNRVVCDYGETDDLVLLVVLSNETGGVGSAQFWPGPRVHEHPYETLAEALAAEPRPNSEGLVVGLLDADGEVYDRVKLKQDDYMALHRILTGTNARNVWEVAAVHACARLIEEPKHWGTYLGMDPARADEVQALGDDWLVGVPDEFHGWIRDTTAAVTAEATSSYEYACKLAETARGITDRQERYEWVLGWARELVKEVMRLASAKDPASFHLAHGGLWLRCWREACPEPTAPFARTEDVA